MILFSFIVITISLLAYLTKLLIILFVIDILEKSDYVSKYLLFFVKYYYILIFFVLISFGVNVIRGI